jgi:hypothetical protein
LAEARPPKSTLRQHRLQIRSAPPVLCRPHFYVPQKIWNQGACRYRNQRQQKSLSDRPCIHDVTSHLDIGLDSTPAIDSVDIFPLEEFLPIPEQPDVPIFFHPSNATRSVHDSQ